MSYARLNMLYQDYDWKELPGSATLQLDNCNPPNLDRKDGFQIQCFIDTIDKNRFASQATKDILQKLERMIRQFVPINLKSQKSILGWMISNYALVE